MKIIAWMVKSWVKSGGAVLKVPSAIQWLSLEARSSKFLSVEKIRIRFLSPAPLSQRRKDWFERVTVYGGWILSSARDDGLASGASAACRIL